MEFATEDLTTGTRSTSIRIHYGGRNVPIDMVNMFAASVRVSTWPSGADATVTQTTSTVEGSQLPDGTKMAGYGQIDSELDASSAEGAWYAISMVALPDGSDWHDESRLFRVDERLLGVRISPAHPAVLAAARACAQENARVAVHVRFSEAVTKGADAVAITYGVGARGCAMTEDSANETVFTCTGTASNEPFTIRIGDTVAAQSSGAQVPARMIRSADMQPFDRQDGCTVYKALYPDAPPGP